MKTPHEAVEQIRANIKLLLDSSTEIADMLRETCNRNDILRHENEELKKENAKMVAELLIRKVGSSYAGDGTDKFNLPQLTPERIKKRLVTQ